MEKAIIIFHTYALIEFDKCGIDVDNGYMKIFIEFLRKFYWKNVSIITQKVNLNKEDKIQFKM